jgi:hypothetical protein
MPQPPLTVAGPELSHARYQWQKLKTACWQKLLAGFLLFAKAFLAVVNFVCVLAVYNQLAKNLFLTLFFPFSCLMFQWIVCSILGTHIFFVKQPKSAIKKNSILIKTRRSAVTSHPPQSRYPFTQTLPSTSLMVAVARAVVVVMVLAVAVVVAGGVVAVVLAVAVAVAVAVWRIEFTSNSYFFQWMYCLYAGLTA